MQLMALPGPTANPTATPARKLPDHGNSSFGAKLADSFSDAGPISRGAEFAAREASSRTGSTTVAGIASKASPKTNAKTGAKISPDNSSDPRDTAQTDARAPQDSTATTALLSPVPLPAPGTAPIQAEAVPAAVLSVSIEEPAASGNISADYSLDSGAPTGESARAASPEIAITGGTVPVAVETSAAPPPGVQTAQPHVLFSATRLPVADKEASIGNLKSQSQPDVAPPMAAPPAAEESSQNPVSPSVDGMHAVNGATPDEMRPQRINSTAWVFRPPRPPSSQIFGEKLKVDDAVPASALKSAQGNYSTVQAASAASPAPTIAPRAHVIDSIAVTPTQLEPPASVPLSKTAPEAEASAQPQASPRIESATVSDNVRLTPNANAPAPQAVVNTVEGSKPAATGEATPDSTEAAKKVSGTAKQDSVPAREMTGPAMSGKEAGAANPIPVPAPNVPPPATHAQTPEARELPKTQQMLDSTPPAAPGAPPLARVTAESGGDVQMRLGIRTTAFGTVEIQTTLHQNQVGLSLHGDGGLARWFSSEVQNIESGLKDYRLNLANVQLDGGSSGLQTATSFHHEQSQRNFAAHTGVGSSASLSETNPDAEPAEFLVSDLPIRSAEGRVSIRI